MASLFGTTKQRARSLPKTRAGRDSNAAAQRRVRHALFEVGAIPEPADWARRNSCENSLGNFICTYKVGFDKGTFEGRLFPDQLAQIHNIEVAITNRGCYAFTNFRGGGKTAIISAARMWVMLYGHADWLVTIFANRDAVDNARDSMLDEMLSNEQLGEDFPEMYFPTKQCDGNSARLRSQVCNGIPTKFKLHKEQIIFPDVLHAAPWSKCSAAVCEFSSHSSNNIRGKTRSGRRPQVVFLDDIESDTSVASKTKTDNIEQVLSAVAGLGSHYRDVACIWIGTIIASGCLMDRYSNHTLHPAWHGHRYRYMLTPPKDGKLWTKYVEIRRDGIGGGAVKAREFYLANQPAMLEGASVAWPDGYDRAKYEDAIEKFYGLQADKGLKYIACELQNDPSMLLSSEDKAQLDPEALARRTNGYQRGEIPDHAVGLCGFIDVQEVQTGPLYWEVDWFSAAFGGGLHAHGTWPLDGGVPLDHYQKKEEKPLDKAEVLSMAMQDCTTYLKSGDFNRENGTTCPFYIGADSGAGVHQSVVFALARQENLIPTKGVGIKTQVLGSGKNTKALARGQDWYTSYQTDTNGVVAAVLNFESRRWKVFARDRLQSPRTSASSWLFWGGDGTLFRSLIAHYCAEVSTEMATPEGGKYTIWRQIGANHWWDCHVGCHAIASHALGLNLKVEGGLVKPMQRRRRTPFRLDVTPV